MKKRNNILLLFLIIAFNIFAQKQEQPWVFLKTTDGISIYHRTIPNTDIYELKLTTIFKTTPLELIKTIKKVEQMPLWSHSCKETKLVKRMNDNDFYYYYVADIPWPIKGKDVVLHYLFYADTITGKHVITSTNFNGLVPVYDNYTRTDYMKCRWDIVPNGNSSCNVEYFISVKIDDGYPDWLINKTMNTSPIKSILNLKKIVE